MSDTPDLPDDEEGTELLQVWLVGEGTLHCSIDPSVSIDPEFWSQILADLARNVAGMIADETKADPEALLRQIQAGFIEDLNAEEGEEGEDA